MDPAAFLISVPYLVALGCALVEHALESRFVPRLKDQTYISYIGLGMIILGEVTRKLAVVTASRNFTHDIKVDRRSDHQLVTHGIYRCGSVISQPLLIMFWCSSFLCGEACKSPPLGVSTNPPTSSYIMLCRFSHRLTYPYLYWGKYFSGYTLSCKKKWQRVHFLKYPRLI